jgi:hypothetical protein
MAKDDRTDLHLLVPKPLKERFKRSCLARGLNMSDVGADLIEQWLKENEVILEEEKKLPVSIAQVVQQNFWALRQHNIKNIDEIASGQPPTKADIIRISSILNIDQGELLQLAKKQFGTLPKSNPIEQ